MTRIPATLEALDAPAPVSREAGVIARCLQLYKLALSYLIVVAKMLVALHPSAEL